MASLRDKSLFRINDAIMAIDFRRAIERDPKLHIGLNPLLLTMRQELHALNGIITLTRKHKLRKLLIEDYLQEDEELRQFKQYVHHRGNHTVTNSIKFDF